MSPGSKTSLPSLEGGGQSDRTWEVASIIYAAIPALLENAGMAALGASISPELCLNNRGNWLPLRVQLHLASGSSKWSDSRDPYIQGSGGRGREGGVLQREDWEQASRGMQSPCSDKRITARVENQRSLCPGARTVSCPCFGRSDRTVNLKRPRQELKSVLLSLSSIFPTHSMLFHWAVLESRPLRLP